MIFHGNGGNGGRHLYRFKREYPELANQFILVSPNGYLRSWNVVAEQSRAPDVAFVEKIIGFILSFRNVKTDISLYGVSNGAGFVNNLLIQSDHISIKRGIAEVSQLHVKQYHGHKLWAQGPKNQYKTAKAPLRGRKNSNHYWWPRSYYPFSWRRIKNPSKLYKDQKTCFYFWGKYSFYLG